MSEARCRSCDRPIALRATDDQLIAVEPDPVELIMGAPRQLVQAVTGAALISAFLPGGPERRVVGWVRHWFYHGCRG